MSTQKKDQYRETVPHKSHFVPVSVHTTKIEIPTETDGVAALPEKNFPALYLHWHPELEFFYVEERVEKASIRQRMEVSSLMVLPFQ